MPTITETKQVPFWHQMAHVEGDDYARLVAKIVERDLEQTAKMGIDPPTIRVSALEKTIDKLLACGIGASDERMQKLPPQTPETYWSMEQQALLQLDHTGEKATVIIRDHYEKQVTRKVDDVPKEEDTEK